MKKLRCVTTVIIFLLLATLCPLAFADDQAEITKAISEGNCEVLFNFVQNPEGKDKKLIDSANNALKSYTRYDLPSEKYRTNSMDSRVRGVGQDLTKRLFENPEHYLPTVVSKLTAGVSDSFHKAKIIHDWICYNVAYDVETFLGGAGRGQDYISVIKNKKAICAGYSELFRYMCALAGVESIVIHGYSKGYGYNGTLGPSTDHAWNAVKINKKWYLVDVTWDAGYLAYNSFIKKYSTDYLFLDSRPFLYTHLPQENKYQFYAPLMTKEQFVKEPIVGGIFFRYGLELTEDLPQYHNIVDGRFTVKVTRRKDNVYTSSQLRTPDQQDVKGGSTHSYASFTFIVPDSQNYEGHIFAMFAGEESVLERITATTYEQRIIPQLDRLLQSNRITAVEKAHFINAYYKLPGSGYYQFLDDQFAIDRNNAVKHIHRLFNLPLNSMSSVLSFNIKKR